MRAPSAWNFSGYLRNSTTSWSSVFASSTPATSANVTTCLLPRNMRARLLPKLIAWLLVPWAWRIMKKMNPPMRRTGSSALMSSPIHWPVWGSSTARKLTFDTSWPPAVAASVMAFQTSVSWLGAMVL